MGFSTGSSCFCAGTKVYVPGKTETSSFNKVNIEDIKVGDQVISFNDKWKLGISTVEKVFTHDERDCVTVHFWGGGELTGTPEHWVLTPCNKFVCLGTLGSEDAGVDKDRQAVPVLGVDYVGKHTVYNLIVDPDHTYFANGVCVHNGGGNSSGGKSESSSSNPIQSIAEPLYQDAVAEYRKLYSDYYWPIEEGLAGLYKTQLDMYSPYATNRFGELISLAEETNSTLDENKKNLIRRLVEGEDVLADRYRSTASADVASSFAQQRQNMLNTANQYGVNPTSGSWLSGLRNISNQEALAQAQARTNASRQAEDTSLQRQEHALDFYTNPELGNAPTPGLAMNTLFSGVGSSNVSEQESSSSSGSKFLGLF